MSNKIQTPAATLKWYQIYGCALFEKWLGILLQKHTLVAYIENYEFIPREINKVALLEYFNADSHGWRMSLDNDGDIVVTYAGE